MPAKESEAETASVDKAASSESSSADVNAAVEELLSSLSDKFASISSEIFAKMDEMSRRIDGLESALQQRPDSGATKPPQ
ncbi:hypothetical protein DCS_05695 [Drechmeria coniospora]|uniref:Heat shock factor binding protein 1 n=1 Tax=Drechmeria coniospora TaxID=98403 RepID=A0A151GNN3_DRECN|nr:hypothetical protein DCS_05695 [Drechmeria coniospora]KYK58678.1 hypothetical protein DCS_05695 [Drechmeria coniospora]